jgi:hypothetical protein
MKYSDIEFIQVGDKYKILYKGQNKKYLVFTTILKGVETPIDSIRYEFNVRGEWFIPNLTYVGCSKIEIRDYLTSEYLFDKVIEPSLNRKVKKQNVICVGLNKSGTSSFVSSLNKLGFQRPYETILIQKCSADVYHDDIFSTLSLLNNERYNLFNDNPFSFPKFYEKIYQHRPNDIYVLTVRENTKKWVKSVTNFYYLNSEFEDKSYIETQHTNGNKTLLVNSLSPLFNSWNIRGKQNLEKQLTTIYEKHVEDTIQFFSTKKANFMVVDVSKKGELKRFCDWMNIPTESEDFDWVNKTKVD